MSRAEAPASLIANEWFRELPDAVVAELSARARPQRLVDGERLYSRGDPPAGFHGVVSGRIRLSAVAPDGREVIVAMHEPGNWFGEVTLFDGRQRLQDAHADGDTELLSIAHDDFHAWLQANPDLYPHFMRMLCRKLRMAIDFAEDLMFRPLSARLAKRLLALHHAYAQPGEGGELINLHLPQDDLARMVGATRQSVSRELKRWEADGVLSVAYGRITVRDPAALAAEAGAAQ